MLHITVIANKKEGEKKNKRGCRHAKTRDFGGRIKEGEEMREMQGDRCGKIEWETHLQKECDEYLSKTPGP